MRNMSKFKNELTYLFVRALVSFTFLLAGAFANAQASDIKSATPGNSSIAKLGLFSAACDAPQIASLLKRDSGFDINSYPVTLTPVQLAQTRLATSLKSGDIYYQNACVNTITTIMTDKRYGWREVGSRQSTDLMHLVGVLKDAKKDVLETTLGVVLDLIAKNIKDFDINYRIKAAHPFYLPGTVAGTLADAGNIDSWCMVKRRFPISLEDRPSFDYPTPILLAVTSNKIEMVKLLVSEGADWDAYVSDIPNDWAAQRLATNHGYKDIEQWLIQHRQGIAAAGASCR